MTCKSPGYVNPGCLNATHWRDLHDFGLNSGSDFIFGVAYGLEQACREGSNYTWNASNAATLLEYIKSNGQHVWGFELGNEVNNNGPGTACNQDRTVTVTIGRLTLTLNCLAATCTAGTRPRRLQTGPHPHFRTFCPHPAPAPSWFKPRSRAAASSARIREGATPSPGCRVISPW